MSTESVIYNRKPFSTLDHSFVIYKKHWFLGLRLETSKLKNEGWGLTISKDSVTVLNKKTKVRPKRSKERSERTSGSGYNLGDPLDPVTRLLRFRVWSRSACRRRVDTTMDVPRHPSGNPSSVVQDSVRSVCAKEHTILSPSLHRRFFGKPKSRHKCSTPCTPCSFRSQRKTDFMSEDPPVTLLPPYRPIYLVLLQSRRIRVGGSKPHPKTDRRTDV